MMNNENQISKETKLFGYIGEHAGVSRFSAISNKLYKTDGFDAMMIPMNIREDDLYFTVANMKKSHVNGAVISSEYVSDVLEIMDDASSIAKRSGMCDIIFRVGDTLEGDVFSMRVLTEHLKDMNISKVAIIGTNHYAKAFSFLACGFNVSYFNENLEELMSFTQEVELNDADINRIAEGMSVDLSSFDAVLDFSDFDSFLMVEKFAPFNFDMKNSKQFSSLKQRCIELEQKYVSYDDILDKLADAVYKKIKK
jgi:shikimate 5-dehydrogenase